MAPNWSVAASKELLETACSALGVRYDHLELVRFGTNAVYHLQPVNVAARVTRPGAPWEWTKREATITRWLSERGFPAVAPDQSITPEPFRVYDSVVTFWPWLQASGNKITPTAFGELLHDLHQLGNIYPHPLPPWQPLLIVETLLSHLRDSDRLAPADLQLLQRWHYWISQKIDDHPSQLGTGLIHGDAHIGNCLMTTDGPLLLDFDYVCSGPREWDLIPETLGPRRFGRARENYTEFAEGYGHDVTQWEGYRTCALARELLITCWRLDVESISAVREEGERRLKYWRREPEPPGWKAF